MSNKTLKVLFEDLIEVIMRNVENEDQRYDIYDDMLQPFEAAGLDEFEELLGFDPVFDKVYLEHYPELVREDE